MHFPDPASLFLTYLTKYMLISLRYGVFTGGLYAIFYLWKRRELVRYKIQQSYPAKEHIIREIGYSFLSLAIVALVGTGLDLARKNGHSKIYVNLHEHSLGYFLLSVLAFIIIHDTYFYWTHRLMHWKAIFKYVHRIHHLSTNPTPWAAFSFHPIEALVQVGILPLVTFLFPIHPLAILAWIAYQTSMNVMGHLGFEFFPSGFVTGRLTKWHNTSTHHNMHHRYIGCNYGLYYNIWDRLMGTNHSDYAKEFERVTKRARAPERGGLEVDEPPAT